MWSAYWYEIAFSPLVFVSSLNHTLSSPVRGFCLRGILNTVGGPLYVKCKCSSIYSTFHPRYLSKLPLCFLQSIIIGHQKLQRWLSRRRCVSKGHTTYLGCHKHPNLLTGRAQAESLQSPSPSRHQSHRSFSPSRPFSGMSPQQQKTLSWSHQAGLQLKGSCERPLPQRLVRLSYGFVLSEFKIKLTSGQLIECWLYQELVRYSQAELCIWNEKSEYLICSLDPPAVIKGSCPVLTRDCSVHCWIASQDRLCLQRSGSGHSRIQNKKQKQPEIGMTPDIPCQPIPQPNSPDTKASPRKGQWGDRRGLGLWESLDTFAALAEGEGGVLDLEAAAAVPEIELRRYLEQSLLDPNLIPTLRNVRAPFLIKASTSISACLVAIERSECLPHSQQLSGCLLA